MLDVQVETAPFYHGQMLLVEYAADPLVEYETSSIPIIYPKVWPAMASRFHDV